MTAHAAIKNTFFEDFFVQKSLTIIIKRGTIKSENQVEEEIYSALGKNEEKIIAYVLNEDGKFILSAVAKDDANETYLTISLEENHD